MVKYYLAHPFDSRKEMRVWELHLALQYEIDIVNPFYSLHRDDVISIDEGRAGRYEKLDPDELVMRDLEAIGRCNAIIAYVNGDLSYGTIMEIVYASKMNKEIHIIVTNGHEKHPWIVFHADHIYLSKQEFEESL